MESMWPISKTEMLIYQSKANIYENILFREITHHLDQEIRKMLVKGMFGNEDPHSILVNDLGPIHTRTKRNGTERKDMELFQKTKEFLQVFTRERLETFRSVPKSGRV